MPSPQLTELIVAPDVVELVRDQVCAILALELDNQHYMALDAALPDSADYLVRVLRENERPIDAAPAEKGTQVFPLVNVQLSKTSYGQSSAVNNQNAAATLLIDCYADGNDVDSDDEYDDERSALRAWKTARLVRNILMAGCYTYVFDTHGVVASRKIMSMEGGYPANLDNAANAVYLVRITFNVQFTERTPQVQGTEIDAWTFKSVSQTGEVLIDM